jgi:hypothetical protein
MISIAILSFFTGAVFGAIGMFLLVKFCTRGCLRMNV